MPAFPGRRITSPSRCGAGCGVDSSCVQPAASCSACTPARVARPTARDWALRPRPGHGQRSSPAVPDTTRTPAPTRGGAHGPSCIGDPYPSPPSRHTAFLEAAGGYLGRRSLSHLNRGVLGGNLCLGAGFRRAPCRKNSGPGGFCVCRWVAVCVGEHGFCIGPTVVAIR